MTKQIYGYNKDEKKVTGMNVVQVRERGAVGPIFKEYEVRENGQWIIVIEAIKDGRFISI